MDGINVFDAAVQHVRDLQAGGHHVILGAWSEAGRW
jgi:transcription-repair coupling factor (superfamily II helicase)